MRRCYSTANTHASNVYRRVKSTFSVKREKTRSRQRGNGASRESDNERQTYGARSKERPYYEHRLHSERLRYDPLDVPGQAEVPRLANNVDRTLFSPGVHLLKDPRTNVYNFDTRLENIMSIRDFDFSAIPPYVPSGKDGKLAELAMREGKKFVGSTSSLTGILTQIHFMISNHRPPHLMSLPKYFPETTTTFSASQRSPTVINLRYNRATGTYSVNSSDSKADSMILTLLGQAMETMLVTDADIFQNYDKKQSHKLNDGLKAGQSTYNYTTCGDFLMRSQLDCYDPRLPGTGMFDLKTRAVCAIRHDVDYAQIHDGSDYQLMKLNGTFESYQREFYELIRSAMFKYSLQARIGRMDGIFVAYHNIRTLFGFEYLPLQELDKIFHTSHLIGSEKGQPDFDLEAEMSRVGPIIAEGEFKLSVSFLSSLLETVLRSAPENARDEAFNIVVHSPRPGELNVFAKPMLDRDLGSPSKSTADAQRFDYAMCEDPFSLMEHYSANAQVIPPDVQAFKIRSTSVINGVIVPEQMHPSPTNASDRWTLDYKVYKLSPSEAQHEYGRTMSQILAQELTSVPITERLGNEAEVRELALEKLPSPSTLQELLRRLDDKGRAYKQWDDTRAKTLWRPSDEPTQSV